MSIKKEVGARVRAVRILKNMTQEQLAEKLDISFQVLSRIERGDNFFSSELLEKLCIVLEVKPSTFLSLIALGKPKRSTRKNF